MKKHLLLFGAFMLYCAAMYAQNLSDNDYKKAVWMTTRMYGGQRSGDGPNWLIMDHTPNSSDMTTLTHAKGADVSKLQSGKDFTKDADVTHSLSGGWVDCGDHVKFGQTFFFAAYTVLKGYAEFPQGYDDHYSLDYHGYQAAGDFSWEGAHGAPNGIPDVLDELKYQCDFLIKCAPNSTTFYSQVGEGGADHLNWVTSVAMATLPKSQGGQNDGSRNIVKNPDDASMPSFCAATLALMARVYEPFDSDYAARCLVHAKYAYEYASSKSETTNAGSFYPANKKWEDDYICASAELYWTTEDEQYKINALALSNEIENHNWCFNYNNNDDLAAYNLAKLGDQSGRSVLKSLVDSYKSNVGSNGVYSGGDSTWGPLRYNASAAFVVALWGALNNDTDVDPFIVDNIDYILGYNNSNFSFVVGFEREDCNNCQSAQHPHHRNVYLIDNIMANQATMQIPERNRQHGYLIGGSRTVPFQEDATDYKTSEGGIDYNAGLVGAIGYIVSRVAPVDNNQFGHPTPKLEEEYSLCGTGLAILIAEVDLSDLTSGETVEFQWFKNEASTPFAKGANKTSVTVDAIGEYTCKLVETSGAWETEVKTVVRNVLPSISLGADFELCNPSYKTLSVTLSSEAYNYAWYADGEKVSTEETYTVYNAGTFSVEVSTDYCSASTDVVNVSSGLPSVTHATISSPGVAHLAVNDTEGSFEWYSDEEATQKVGSGFTYDAIISSSRTFYVKDVSSFRTTIGASAINHTLTDGTNAGVVGLNFHAKKEITIEGLTVAPFVYSYNSGDKVYVEFELFDASNNSVGTYATNKVDCNGLASGENIVYYPLQFETPIALSPGQYILKPKNGNQIIWFQNGASYSSYNSDGVVNITGDTRSDEANSMPGLFDIIISSGTDCAAQPVFAIVDESNTNTYNTWLGGTDSNETRWNTASNWSKSTVPVSSDDVIIPEVAHMPIISATDFAECNDLKIDANASLTILSNATHSGGLKINGVVTGNGASNVKYQSHVGAVNFQLVSAPLQEQNIGEFYTSNASNIKTKGDLIAIAPYCNNQETPEWKFYSSSQGENNISKAGDFVLGKGYEMLARGNNTGTADNPVYSNEATLCFTGKPYTGDLNFSVTDGVSFGNSFNLVGNPYTTALCLNEQGEDDKHSFFNTNFDKLDDDHCAVYVWDNVAKHYVVINEAYSGSFCIAPGQAFFINDKAGNTKVSFTKAMRTSDVELGLKSATLAQSEYKLNVKGYESSASSRLVLNETCTDGLDRGWDAGRLSVENSDVVLYSSLINSSSDTEFSLQCFAKPEAQNKVVPLGVKVTETQAVEFSSEELNLSDQKVYLHDKQTNVSVDLSNENYSVEVTPEDEHRFELVFEAKSITPVETITQNKIKVYAYKQTVVVENFEQKSGLIKVYTNNGTLIKQEPLTGATYQEFTLNKPVGVYFIAVYDENGVVKEKVIIE